METLQPLTHERAHLMRRSAHRERAGGLDRKHATAGHSGVKGVGENGQVRQLGHALRLYGGARPRSDPALGSRACAFRYSIVDHRCVC